MGLWKPPGRAGWVWLLLLALLAPWAQGAEPDPSALPFERAYAADLPGQRLEVRLRVTEKQTYTFGLSYYFSAAPGDSQRVQRLAGESTRNTSTGAYVNLGVPLTLRLRITAADGPPAPPVFDRVESQIVKYAADDRRFDKRIADVLLAPGIYTVSLESLAAAPELKGTQVGFHVRQAYLGK